MKDPYNMDRAEETARRMLKRYSTPVVAREMALEHSCDFQRDSRQAVYWRSVAHHIYEIDHHSATRFYRP